MLSADPPPQLKHPPLDGYRPPIAKPRPPQVAQSPAELQAHLAEHLAFLSDSADAYDRGQDGEAKRLAVSLRVLCHDTAASHSLLGQLGRLSEAYVSTAIPHDPRNVMPHNGLAMVAARGRDTAYIAMLDGSPFRKPVPFADWWNEIVFVDDKRAVLTRRDLVLAIANQDGGAHVDPSLDETYARLSRHNSLGWTTNIGGDSLPIPKPERAAIRQIAHEVLASLVPGYAKKSEESAEMFFGGVMAFDGVPPEWAQYAKVGRNDPCTCGSGKKYKKCHGAV